MATILTKKRDTTGAPSAGDLTNSASGAELAVNTFDKRLYTKDSGGNVVEIGTNPGAAVTFTAGTVSAPSITPSGDTNTGIFFPAADTIAFAEGGVEAMRIDSSGNVGIGVTPFANSLGKSLDIVNGVGLFGSNNNTYISANAHYDSNWKYKASAAAAFIGLESGSVRFNTAYSGTAGNNITFTERARITSDGEFLIATTTHPATLASASTGTGFGFLPGNALILAADNGNNCLILNKTNSFTGTTASFRYNGGIVGNISITTTATAYNTSSDYRLKENVQPMQNALATVLRLKPCTYTWKADGSAGQGFIAHELQAVVPDAVTGEKDATSIEQYEISPAIPATYDEDGNELTPAVEAVMGERVVPVYQGVDTSFLVATLTAAIQELSAKNDALEARLAALEAK